MHFTYFKVYFNLLLTRRPKGLPIGNGIWGIEWSRDPERSNSDPNTLRVNISKTAGDAIWQQSLITR